MPSELTSETVTGSSTAALPSEVFASTPFSLTVKETVTGSAGVFSSITSRASSVSSVGAWVSGASVAGASVSGACVGAWVSGVSVSGASVTGGCVWGASVSRTGASASSTGADMVSCAASSAKTLVGIIPTSITRVSSSANIRRFIEYFPSAGHPKRNARLIYVTAFAIDYELRRDAKTAILSHNENIAATISSNSLTRQ